MKKKYITFTATSHTVKGLKKKKKIKSIPHNPFCALKEERKPPVLAQLAG